MKISIITVVYNGAETIKNTIDSVLSQSYQDIEYIIIDGASSDGTVEIVQSYGNKITKFISEKDKGLYDAMNKGIGLATGYIVGIINSDDFYIDENAITKVMSEFHNKNVDSVYADLLFVERNNTQKTIRYYDSSYFTPKRFAYGWMPAHPTFFVKRECYLKHGLYKTDYKISADYDLLMRFLAIKQITYAYIEEPLVKMRAGGISTGFTYKYTLNKEVIRACKENGIYTNWLMILSKYPRKLFTRNKFKNLSTR